MNKKDFLPYDLAIQFKELGFSQEADECFDGIYYYTMPNGSVEIGHVQHTDVKRLTKPVYAPLYQEAFGWLRQEYGLFCWVYPTIGLGNKETAKWTFDTTDFTATSFRFYTFDTYEEAEVACLVACIKILIEKVILNNKP